LQGRDGRGELGVLRRFLAEGVDHVVVRDDPHQPLLVVHDGNGQEVVLGDAVGDLGCRGCVPVNVGAATATWHGPGGLRQKAPCGLEIRIDVMPGSHLDRRNSHGGQFIT